MTDFEAIDALLAGARKEVPLPPSEQRRTLREGLNVSRAQLARALDVGPSTSPAATRTAWSWPAAAPPNSGWRSGSRRTRWS